MCREGKEGVKMLRGGVSWIGVGGMGGWGG